MWDIIVMYLPRYFGIKSLGFMKGRLHHPPFRGIFTWLRPTPHFTFTSCIPKNQHPKLLTAPHIYLHLSKSGLSLHFSHLFHSSMLHLDLSKTYPYLPMPLSFLFSRKTWLLLDVFSLMSVISSSFPILCCPPWRAAQLSSLSVTGLTEFLCKMLHIMQ